MVSIKEIKQQAKKAYKFDVGRNANVEFISFLSKFSLLFTLFTIFIIGLAKLGRPTVSLPALLFFVIAYILIYLFVIAPINAGRNLYFTKVADSVQPETDEMFHFYKNLKMAIYPYFRIAIAMVFYTVFFTALLICYFRIFSLFSNNYFSFFNFIISVAIIVLYFVSVTVTRMKYSLFPVVYMKHSTGSAVSLLSKTLRCSYGTKSGLFMLHLSFTGWYVLGILSLGIGFIWIMPYIRIASKIYLNECVK